MITILKQQHQITHPHAEAAVKAAMNEHRWGKGAATQYALKRGASPALIRLARQLQAVEDFESSRMGCTPLEFTPTVVM